MHFAPGNLEQRCHVTLSASDDIPRLRERERLVADRVGLSGENNLLGSGITGEVSEAGIRNCLNLCCLSKSSCEAGAKGESVGALPAMTFGWMAAVVTSPELRLSD